MVPMRRFFGSAWFAFLTCVFLAGVTAAAFALLAPTGENIGNTQIHDAMKIAGWVAGPAIALLAFILILILNGLRRLFRIRQVALLHPVVVFLGILPFLILAWELAGEPPYTPIARGVTEFIARPLLWGAGSATDITILAFIITLFTKKQA